MAVLQESPWYQEILQQGERKGREEGKQEGREEGKQEGREEGREEERRSITLKFLTRRVGDLSPALAAQVQALSLVQLEALGEALLNFSEMSDFVNWLLAHG